MIYSMKIICMMLMMMLLLMMNVRCTHITQYLLVPDFNNELLIHDDGDADHQSNGYIFT